MSDDEADYEADYDRIWAILMPISDECATQGIPKTSIPPVLADYLILSVLALGLKSGLSEVGAEAIIARMQDRLEDFRNQRPPFDAGFPGREIQG